MNASITCDSAVGIIFRWLERPFTIHQNHLLINADFVLLEIYIFQIVNRKGLCNTSTDVIRYQKRNVKIVAVWETLQDPFELIFLADILTVSLGLRIQRHLANCDWNAWIILSIL